MRVALLTNFIPPYRLPLYRAIANSVGSLRVFLSTPMETNRHWPVKWDGLDVILQRSFSFRRTWHGGSFRERIDLHVPYDTLLQLRRFAPDVILTGEMGARSLQAALFGRLMGTPVVLWATVSDRLEVSRGSIRRVVRRWLVRNVHSFIVNGESGAKYLRGLGISEARMLRVPYTTDMRELLSFQPRVSGDGERTFLYVGAISERKGIHLLVDALRLLAAQHPTILIGLVVVGDGPLRATLQEVTLPTNLRVVWVGNVPYDAVPTWYQRAHALVFPTFGDEWGLVVNEGLAAGLPVVGSVYSQAVEELITDNVNGWLFAPDSVEAVMGALSRALSASPADLKKMSMAARNAVMSFTPEAAGERIAAHLREISDAASPLD